MIQTKDYIKTKNMHELFLDNLYDGSNSELVNLDYNLNLIINTEAPITLNILKERLREAFNIKKISGKAFEIINKEIDKLGFIVEEDLLDKVYYPASGKFCVDYVRINYKRQIFDVPYDEIKNVVKEYRKDSADKETIYRKTLAYFGYEVLTKKAEKYLSYVLERLSNETK